MTRTLAAVLLLAAGCSSASREEGARQQLFDRLGFLRAHYNAALLDQDPLRLEAVSSDVKQIVVRNFADTVGGLSGEDPDRQTLAAFGLGFSSNREAIGPLVQATASPDPSVRANAAASLGMLGFPDVPSEPFQKLLEDPDPKVRTAALFGLRLLLSPGEDRGLLSLVHQKLADPVMDVRNETLILLRKLKRKESVEPILAKPIFDEDPLVRSNAAATLGSIGRDAIPANPYLIEMLKDEVSSVVESVWTALNRINQKDLDRSYSTWKDWYEDELKYEYVCPTHPDVKQPTPGECPQCKAKLQRTLREPERKKVESAGPYACPDHPGVVTTSPSKCGMPGCGKSLVPKK